MGMHAEACKNISRHAELDETFYIVDLGNVLRMYKVMTVPPLCCAKRFSGLGFTTASAPPPLHFPPSLACT